MTPDDLRSAASVLRDALRDSVDSDWDAPAGSLDWTCRRTLDHVPDALLLYSAHLSTRATRPRPFLRNGDPAAPVTHLLSSATAAAAILAAVVAEAPPSVRAYHPAGMADPSGFAAMGCDELLVHTFDLASGLGVACAPPPDLCARVLARLFPWAPTEHDAWSTLLWANGRIELPGHPMLDADWAWQCAPIAEWDGITRRRLAPPAW
jgi:hypothetical protein